MVLNWLTYSPKGIQPTYCSVHAGQSITLNYIFLFYFVLYKCYCKKKIMFLFERSITVFHNHHWLLLHCCWITVIQWCFFLSCLFLLPIPERTEPHARLFVRHLLGSTDQPLGLISKGWGTLFTIMLVIIIKIMRKVMATM